MRDGASRVDVQLSVKVVKRGGMPEFVTQAGDSCSELNEDSIEEHLQAQHIFGAPPPGQAEGDALLFR